jgi:3-dehydroquinate synthase
VTRTLRPAFAVRFDYPVHFTRDLFAPGNPLLRDVLSGGDHGPARVAWVLDAGLHRRNPWLGSAVAAYCERHRDAVALAGDPLCVPGGEEAKRGLRWVRAVHELVHRTRLCRHSYLVVAGGGAVIDAAGLAAATAHRGVRLVRIPTTVLAQNDAAVGVKNGVNAHGRKNWLGTFAPPWAVICDAAFLATLSDRDWRAGMAEAVKVALLRDPSFFSWLERASHALADRDLDAMEELVHRCAALHLDHITRGGDPFELGSARPLDFGHWSAHRLESLSRHRLRHGEAVAVGIALDCAYSRLSGLLGEADLERVLALLQALGLDLWVPELARTAAVVEGLDEFREHLGGRLTITLLRGIGCCSEVGEMNPELIGMSIGLLERRAGRRP